MPVRIVCSSCGKKLSVRDELAGKKVKCPGCGTVFVAAADGAATGVKAKPPMPSPMASAKDKVSAKPMAKRPAPPPIEDEDDEMDERPVRGGKPARMDEDEDDGRPSRSKRGKQAAAGGSKLWLWLVLGGVLLIGGAAGVYFVFFTGPASTGPIAKGKGPQDNAGAEQKGAAGANPGGGASLADLVPGDAFFFASVSGEVWNAKALEGLKPLFGKTVEDEFQKNVGIPLSDLERISVFTVTNLEEAKRSSVGKAVIPAVIMVQSKKPFDQPAVTAALKGGELGKNPQMSVVFVDDRTLVTSMAPLLQMYKDKQGKTKATGALERALAQATTSKGLVVSVVIPPEVAKEAEQGLKDVQQFAGPFLKTKAAFASLELTERLQLNASLIMEDAAAATAAKQAADGLVGLAGLMLGQFGKDPQMAELVKTGQQALHDLKIGSSGSSVLRP